MPAGSEPLHLADASLVTLDPFAIRIAGEFGVRWYGLAYAAGFVIAYLLARYLAKKRIILLTTAQVGDFIIACIIGVMVGGRLGWVLFYNPTALWTFTSSAPWWEVLAINHGGMASHGGMLGVIGAMIWYGRRRGISPFHLFDITALLVPFGFFLGRIANFINGELRGEPCDPGFPLAVKFPHEIREEWGPAKMMDAIGAADALGYARRTWEQIVETVSRSGGDAASWRAFDELRERLFQSVMAGNEQVIAVVKPLLTPRYPSQLFQAAAEGIVLGSVLWILMAWQHRRGEFKARPGIVGVSFLIVYGILRIITELWRRPDLEIGRTLGLSRGQWLSTAMVLAGLLLLAVVWRRRPSAPEPHETSAVAPPK